MIAIALLVAAATLPNPAPAQAAPTPVTPPAAAATNLSPPAAGIAPAAAPAAAQAPANSVTPCGLEEVNDPALAVCPHYVTYNEEGEEAGRHD
jgi:hypothetical protein